MGNCTSISPALQTDRTASNSVRRMRAAPCRSCFSDNSQLHPQMKRLRNVIAVALLLALATHEGRAQWVPTNGPYGGWISSIAHLGDNLFIGTAQGIVESTDRGTTWTNR